MENHSWAPENGKKTSAKGDERTELGNLPVWFFFAVGFWVT